nr:hypothetical protein CFP56_21929 [Quercus suber]
MRVHPSRLGNQVVMLMSNTASLVPWERRIWWAGECRWNSASWTSTIERHYCLGDAANVHAGVQYSTVVGTRVSFSSNVSQWSAAFATSTELGWYPPHPLMTVPQLKPHKRWRSSSSNTAKPESPGSASKRYIAEVCCQIICPAWAGTCDQLRQCDTFRLQLGSFPLLSGRSPQLDQSSIIHRELTWFDLLAINTDRSSYGAGCSLAIRLQTISVAQQSGGLSSI